MALTESFRKNEYLLDYYVEAAARMRDYEACDDDGDRSKAQQMLCEAAKAVCAALDRLSGDDEFWKSLDGLKSTIDNQQAEVRAVFDELDLFIVEEERILLELKLPPTAIRHLLDDLVLALKVYRRSPSSSLVEPLRDGIRDAARASCELSGNCRGDVPMEDYRKRAQRTREVVGALNGIAWIVINAGATVAMPMALASTVGGIVSATIFIDWLKPSKRG